MNEPPLVTLRDVARRANCHYSTVSLALRNRSEIPEATRVRIRQVADEIGYRPDPFLASLASYRHGPQKKRPAASIAWLTNFPTRDGWKQEEIYEECFIGARDRAAELGFQLREFWLREPRMTPARATQILEARGIEGLIVAPQPTPAENVELDWSRFCAVALGYSIACPQLHVITPNQYGSMLLAFSELRKRDYQRIGLVILRASDERVEHNWLAGYLVGQQSLAPANRLSPLILPAWDEKAFASWLKREKPDAIISKCAEALPALKHLGYAVPGEIGAALLTRVKPSRRTSGVSEAPLEVGAAAVDFISGMLRTGDRGVPRKPRRLLVQGEWIEGQTVRRVAQG